MLPPRYRILLSPAPGFGPRFLLALEIHGDRAQPALLLPSRATPASASSPDAPARVAASTSALAVERCRRAVDRLVPLSHPNLLPLLNLADIDEGNGCGPALAFTVPAGETLRAAIARAGRLPAAIAARIVAEVATAIEDLHSGLSGAPVVHGQLRPESVFLTDTGATLLWDWPLPALASDFDAADCIEAHFAAHAAATTALTPEQVIGGPSAATRHTDVHLLGLLLHELLTGLAPYSDQPDLEAAAIVSEPCLDFECIPEPLRPVIARATARKAADRYPSADAFRAAIIEAMGELVTEEIIAVYVEELFCDDEARRERNQRVDSAIATFARAQWATGSSVPRGSPEPVTPASPSLRPPDEASATAPAPHSPTPPPAPAAESAPSPAPTARSIEPERLAAAIDAAPAALTDIEAMIAEVIVGARGDAEEESAGSVARPLETALVEPTDSAPPAPRVAANLAAEPAPTMASAEPTAAEAPDLASTEKTEIWQHPSTTTRAPRSTLLLGLVLLSALAGIGVGVGVGFGSERRDAKSAASAAPPPAAAAAPAEPSTATATATQSAVALATATPPTTMGDPARVGADTTLAAPAATPVAAAPAANAAVAKKPKAAEKALAPTPAAAAPVASPAVARRRPPPAQSPTAPPPAVAAPAEPAAPHAGGQVPGTPAPGETTNRFQIEVTPAVEVAIDGKSAGRSPVAVTLDPGPHRVTLIDRELGIRAERAIQPTRQGGKLAFELGKGAIAVAGPSGSTIYVDGRLLGQIPLAHDLEVWEGSHHILVDMGGARWNQDFSLSDGERIRFQVGLESRSLE